MKNVEIKIVKKVLTITVDLSKEQGTSKSGKSVIIATTEGNQTLENGMSLGLNLYRKK